MVTVSASAVVAVSRTSMVSLLSTLSVFLLLLSYLDIRWCDEDHRIASKPPRSGFYPSPLVSGWCARARVSRRGWFYDGARAHRSRSIPETGVSLCVFSIRSVCHHLFRDHIAAAAALMALLTFKVAFPAAAHAALKRRVHRAESSAHAPPQPPRRRSDNILWSIYV